MQMSLEAITMLMRFHHRSCCSSIRGIFHPYLENNCIFKIRDKFPVLIIWLFLFEQNLQTSQNCLFILIITADPRGLFVAIPSCSFVKLCFIFSSAVLSISSKILLLIICCLIVWNTWMFVYTRSNINDDFIFSQSCCETGWDVFPEQQRCVQVQNL